jgi:hypothetical protein
MGNNLLATPSRDEYLAISACKLLGGGILPPLQSQIGVLQKSISNLEASVNEVKESTGSETGCRSSFKTPLAKPA